MPVTISSMADHLGTYSALVSASELALSAWLRQDEDADMALHATNVLAFVLSTIEPQQLPDNVRQFQAVQRDVELRSAPDLAEPVRGRGM